MTTYLALTTINAQTNGWKCLCYGTNSDKVRAKAENMIGDPDTGGAVRDIYRETEHKNLRVVSKTTAKKNFGVDFEKRFDHLTDETEWVQVK